YSGFRKVENKNWEDASKECIGCGACTNICPTCYCLILNDESSEKEFIKVRSYDSCQWNGYARVAGGGTPRPKMTERFRNRYLCKFDYMPKNFGEIGCTGCGRCTEACAAKIDFRKVVKNISYKSQEVS
ncbi:MAG: 4Fe-4S dicluster domain-containing protein, partial [Ignavibacteria bacterium]|nr:4Fe-4S dicluster domain-containing protein [Ignavibacteria bacterium]